MINLMKPGFSMPAGCTTVRDHFHIGETLVRVERVERISSTEGPSTIRLNLKVVETGKFMVLELPATTDLKCYYEKV